MKLRTIVISAALALGLSSLALAADPATANLSVTASITANCTISTAAVAFGAYDPIVTNKSADLTGTGTVTVTCTNGSDVTIALDQGAHADTGSTDAAPLRRMTDGTDFLSYALYQNSGNSTIWGNTVGTSVDDVGTGVAADHTVYGVVAQNQNVEAGSYTDTVIAGVTF